MALASEAVTEVLVISPVLLSPEPGALTMIEADELPRLG
jgi:hypothetical protein